MIQPGQFGRSAPGESWRRAMEEVAERRAAGAVRRYRVYGRRIEPGWWAYEVGHVAKPLVKKATEAEPPMSTGLVAKLARDMPRCAQRARSHHGGDSKVAWPSQHLATRVAVFLGHTVYQCQLPAPAIGRHWHTTTKKKRRKAY